MPFDPQWPQNGQVVDADRFRDQFTSLKGLIDALQGGGISSVVVDAVNTLPAGTPASVGLNLSGSVLHFTFGLPQGQEGPMGQQGPPFANVVVDSVTTVNPGDPAAVGVSFDGTNVRFTFNIPRGNDGAPGAEGPAGQAGQDGQAGPQGPAGPPFAQAVVDGVTTLSHGQPATANVNFDGTNVRFTFGIPQGAPGEVTEAALATAVAGTSSNSNAVGTLGMVVSDPPTQAEMQTLLNKVDELVLALRR